MPNSGISVGEQLAGSIPAEQPKVVQPEVRLSNGFSYDVEKAKESLAKAFEREGLDDKTYRDFRAKGEEEARRFNGYHLDMEDVRANVRRILLRGEDPQKTNNSNTKESSSSDNGGVFLENSRSTNTSREEPNLH